MRALIPAGGKGTRMAAVTCGQPKELLPVGGGTVIGHVLAEAEEAGVQSTTVISAPTKPELDEWLEKRPKVIVSHQIEPHGLAHAISCGAPFDGPVLVLLPDTIFYPRSPSRELIEALSNADAVVATERVGDEEVRLYGIVELAPDGCVASILEKPRPDETLSRLAVAARYALGPRMLELLLEAVEQFTGPGEIDLTGVINRGIAGGMRVKCVELLPGSRRLDCGSPEGYQEALSILGP